MKWVYVVIAFVSGTFSKLQRPQSTSKVVRAVLGSAGIWLNRRSSLPLLPNAHA